MFDFWRQQPTGNDLWSSAFRNKGKGVLNMDLKALVAQMTLEEKAGLLSGQDFWTTKAVERVGIPAMFVADGPHGLRKQAGASDHLGLMDSVPATCFPSAAGLACSWDRSLVSRVGEALGTECLPYGRKTNHRVREGKQRKDNNEKAIL